MKLRATIMVPLAIALGALVGACPGARPEGLDRTTLPAAVQDDYDVFAQRCSKCHSISRPLDSGIDDDEYWIAYVARMRHMPASGISAEDEQVILRFLRWFSADLRSKKKAKAGG